jgi:hypothetical protein
VAAENARIKSIETLLGKGADATVNAAKYDRGMTKEKVAVLVLEAKETAKDTEANKLAAHIKDGKELAEKVKQIDTSTGNPATSAEEAADAKRKANITKLAAEMNKGRK